MRCEDYIELMSAALDGECTPEERRTLDSHLAVCPSCAELYRQLSGQTAALRALDCQVPADLKATIMSSLPRQEQPAKKHKVIAWKRWIPVAAAACLVLVVSLLPMGRQLSMNSANSAPMAARDGSCVSGASVESKHQYDGVPYGLAPGATTPPAAGQPQPSTTVDAAGPAHYAFAAPQTIRVSYGATPEAPSAVIIGSDQELADYLARFGSQVWDGEGNQLPIEELEQLKLVYTGDYFANRRLLCVVVEAGSGSTRYELSPQGLHRSAVTVLEMVPEVGTCDMAAWLLVAEVDSMFNPGDTLDVEIVESTWE